MKKPNVIIITTDQQRFDSLGCYGSSFVNTPNLNQMASQGALFMRAYCTNPVSTPSRASLFSGRYLSTHGVWNVGMNIPAKEELISHHLKKAGYVSHYIGKAHFNAWDTTGEKSLESLHEWINNFEQFPMPYYGFDTAELALGHTTYGIKGHYALWLKEKLNLKDEVGFEYETKSKHIFGGEAYDWEIPMDLHNSNWVAERSIEYIEKMATNENPFLLSIGFQDPHHPHALPVEYSKKISNEKIPLPQYHDGELDDKPPHFKATREGKLDDSVVGEYPIAGQGGSVDYTKINEKESQMGRTYYYGMVELIDKAVGKILDAVEKAGISEETFIVFTTDHGELLGDHGLWMKGPYHYEQIIRVPLIIKWNRKIISGTKIESISSLADIVPTILCACGEDIPDDIDGVNMMSVLKGQKSSVREHALIECVDDLKKLRLKTIVTERYKLTHYYGKDYGELYDLYDNPSEVINRWNDDSFQGIKANLLGKIIDETERLEKRIKRISYA